MEKLLRLDYASSLTDLCEKNSSFDMGVLRVAYPGVNKNHTSISKETFERCMSSMYNCPVVCHYDRDTDSFGGHDVELVRKNDGSMTLVNLTQPVGVIPEGANSWWDYVEEPDGVKHEYLFTEVLLWKRQEAYQKIKHDGITSHSMELKVKDGKMVDGVFQINDFEFTAFCLISVTPCFESSALEMFAKQDFKQAFSEMMADLKESFSFVNTFNKSGNKQYINSLKGGEGVLDKKEELVKKYGINVDELDFSIDDFSIEELTVKFEEMKSKSKDGKKTETNKVVNQKGNDKYTLTESVVNEIQRVLFEVEIETVYGTCPRYCYVDCDFDRSEVYCWDSNDWLLYGFTYSINGDRVTIDFDSKKRMKYDIVEFDEGAQESPFASSYSTLAEKYCEKAEYETKYVEAAKTIETMTHQLEELCDFKNAVEKEKRIAKYEEIFAKFTDLIGIEDFDSLVDNHEDLSAEALEEKCYAIRGRYGTVAKFSLEGTVPKIKVSENKKSVEPYGGLFEKYGK